MAVKMRLSVCLNLRGKWYSVSEGWIYRGRSESKSVALDIWIWSYIARDDRNPSVKTSTLCKYTTQYKNSIFVPHRTSSSARPLDIVIHLIRQYTPQSNLCAELCLPSYNNEVEINCGSTAGTLGVLPSRLQSISSSLRRILRLHKLSYRHQTPMTLCIGTWECIMPVGNVRCCSVHSVPKKEILMLDERRFDWFSRDV